jgi:hypothetical protein
MKKAKAGSLFLFLLSLAAPLRAAEENRYDVLARAIQPLLVPFSHESTSPNRSMETELVLLDMTGLPKEFVGTRVRLAVQNPDKIRLTGPILGQEITLCRDRKDVWVAPREKAEALLGQYGIGAQENAKVKFRLGNLELPFSQAQLVFLPALFQVKEYAAQDVGGISCRILELNLLPEIARPLRVENWRARLWVRPDYKVAKLEVLQPQWHIVVEVEKLAFLPTLPPATWQPAPEEEPNTLHLKGARLKRLLEEISKNLGAPETPER